MTEPTDAGLPHVDPPPTLRPPTTYVVLRFVQAAVAVGVIVLCCVIAIDGVASVLNWITMVRHTGLRIWDTWRWRFPL
jgi:hypothetical protein